MSKKTLKKIGKFIGVTVAVVFGFALWTYAIVPLLALIGV